MRRSLIAAALTTSLAVAGLMAAPAQAAPDNPLPQAAFGMHVPQIANGADPSISYGSIRLWDSGIAWGQVEQKQNKYWWNGMDAAIASANAQGVKIMYVLGSTPQWAASSTKQGTYPNKGAASNPKSMKDWKDWVTAVAKRYGNSIESYQIWNEANLTTFWQGTPKQMAKLTQEAYKIIRKYDPTAKVVAASSTMRLQSAYKKFFPKYLKELKKLKWPVDAIAIHTYPAGTGSPADRAAFIQQAQKDMKKAGVPASKQLWDTEINYGIKGPGSTPGQRIDGAQAAAWVAQTYLDNIRLGVNRAYWYYWINNSNLVGIQMFDGTAGATGFATVESWLADSYYYCTTGSPNVCQLGDNITPRVAVWSTTGQASFTVPDNATIACDALNQCTPVTPGQQVTIGSMPQWFGTVQPS